MGRLAVVTGGVRGIGAATAQVPQADGDAVASTCHGNEHAAAVFRGQAGIARIEGGPGAVEILVSDARIAGDAILHRMTPERKIPMRAGALDLPRMGNPTCRRREEFE